MISVLSFGYLYWSSSWQWQAHIRGCKLFRPLPRAEMGDFGPFFCKMYFLWVWWSPKKNLVQIFWVLPPQNRLFCPTPWDQLATLRKLGLYRGYDRCIIYAQPSVTGEDCDSYLMSQSVWSCNANKLSVVDHQSLVFLYQICQFLGTTPISAKWNSATTIPAKWPYPPKKTHLCGNLCGNCWWNFFRSPRTLGQRSFWKKRHPIWSTFAPVAPFTICNPIYGLTTLYYISQPRSQMKYSAAMY